MGTITRALANNITTGGIVSASGVSNTSVSAITALPSGIELNDSFQFISSQTASSSASISFTSGLDNTYDVYCFRYFDIHPQTDAKNFLVDFSADGGSSYNLNKQTTLFQSFHAEADNDSGVSYNTSGDLQNTTGGVNLDRFLGADADQAASGELYLYSPDSTTFAKYFKSITVIAERNDYAQCGFIGGYVNSTSAINAVKFEMSSGNIDSGTIKLFGVRNVGISGI